MLSIAGKSYYAAHRLEVCGECGYNFRMGNRLSDLEWDPSAADSAKVYAKAEAMDAEEAKDNMPPRCAPGSPAQPPEAPLRASQCAPSNLDPDALKAWDHDGEWRIVEAPFLLSFSHVEIGSMRQGCHDGDPEFELRQTLHVIAKTCDGCCADPAQLADMARRMGRARAADAPARPTKARIPIPSFTIQDKAQSEAIMLHVVRVLDSGRPMGTEHESITSPVIEVHYTYNTAAGLAHEVMRSIEAGMRLLPPGCLHRRRGSGNSIAPQAIDGQPRTAEA